MLRAAASRSEDRTDQTITEMKGQPRSWRNATSALLPAATAALATVIFIVDVLTPPEFGIAVLYVAVVLTAARFCQPRGVVLVAAGCIGLTVVSYFLSAETAINGDQRRGNRADNLSRAAKPIGRNGTKRASQPSRSDA
jgi:cell division protein FtsW (lipid II flippase)